LANADPATVTCTPEPASWPGTTPSIEPMPPGDVGDPPQAENSVASVAPDAT
jgi:hypothetical protein